VWALSLISGDGGVLSYGEAQGGGGIETPWLVVGTMLEELREVPFGCPFRKQQAALLCGFGEIG